VYFSHKNTINGRQKANIKTENNKKLKESASQRLIESSVALKDSGLVHNS